MATIVIMLSTYNGETFLNSQLESIVNQNIDATKILYIRDDCSHDNTMEILHSYEKKISILYEESSGKVNLGPAQSYWRLLKTAPEADFYCFADQDDIWDYDKLHFALKNLETDNPLLYCCNSQIIDSEDNVICKQSLKCSPLLNIPSQIVGGEIPGCAMVFNLTLKNNIVSQSINYVPMHDWIIVLYALAVGRVIYDEQPHYRRRVHEKNVIANTGKTKCARIRQSLMYWKNLHKVQFGMIQELYNNIGYLLSKQEAVYLLDILRYKNLRYKLKILCSKMTKSNNSHSLRSFKIRVLLGLL